MFARTLYLRLTSLTSVLVCLGVIVFAEGGCTSITDQIAPGNGRGAAKPTIMVGRSSTNRPVDASNTSVDLVNVLRAELETQNWKVGSVASGAADQADNHIDASKHLVDIGGDQQALSRLITAIESTSDEGFKIRARNHVVGEIIFASDGSCADFVRRVRTEQVGGRLATDALSGGLAMWSSLAAPVSTAKLLAGLSAFSVAEGSSIDRNAYAQTAAELISDQIIKLRAADRIVIEVQMKKPYADWPLSLALADAVNYHRDCSLNRGLAQMKEILVARESTISAIRAAASQVYAAGGDKRQIVAVLSALGPDPVTSALQGASTEVAGAWSGDLDQENSRASQCLDQWAAYERSRPVTSTVDLKKVLIFNATGACVSSNGVTLQGKTSWALMFQVALDAAVQTGTWSTCQPATGNVKPADAWASCIDTNVGAIRTSYEQTAASLVATKSTIRSVTATRLDNWQDAETTATLASDIVALGGFQLVDPKQPPTMANLTLAGDPVMVAAASEVLTRIAPPISNTSAHDVAQLARATAQQQYATEILHTKPST